MQNERYRFLVLFILLFLVGGMLAGCQPEETTPPVGEELAPVPLEGDRLQVAATTSLVADVVANVGGEHIVLIQLVESGVDPHAFEPTPQDVAAFSDAHVVFVNGAGLEVFLEDLLAAAGEESAVVSVSRGIDLLRLEEEHEHEEEEEEEHEHEHEHGEADPHVWFNPRNVILWVDVIEATLSALDPGHAADYAENAQAYREQLRELDGWIEEQVAQVPLEDRLLVTDHTVFTYFAQAYGFEQVGAVIPGYSTLAQPSARELAELTGRIEQFDVRAIFVGNTVNPDLAQQVAEDTGTRLVFLYTGSLSEPGGPADSYLSFMRYNVSRIVEALQ